MFTLKKTDAMSIDQNNFEFTPWTRHCQEFAAKIEVSTTYIAVTNYAELAAQRQQFSVPYFSHDSRYVPHFRCVQWCKFIVRAAQHSATSSSSLASTDGTPRGSEIVLHFEKRAISRTSKRSDTLHQTASRCVACARANTMRSASIFCATQLSMS